MSNLDGLTSGISTKLIITSPDGVQDFANLESFKWKEDSPIIKKVDIGGVVRNAKLCEGASGTFVFQRGNSVLDKYIIGYARNYRLGGDQVDLTINQSIVELDGSTTQLQFTKVVITLTDAGTYSGTEIVSETAEFVCSTVESLS